MKKKLNPTRARKQNNKPKRKRKMSMKSFLALITPMASSVTTPPGKPADPAYDIPESGLERPTHPIWLPLPPGAPIDPEYGIDIGQEGPAHPIQPVPPGPAHPIQPVPPGPAHPIVLPPDTEGGWDPVYIWGGGPGVRPPLPVPPENSAPPGGKVEWKAAWTPTTGWIVVGLPTGPVPTPSKK